MFELLVAMVIVTATILPLAYAFASEKRLALSYYQRAVAMELVDGETEVLAAGEWRTFPPGTHPYPIHADAATNLPPGQFWLTIQTNTVRLEWQPSVTRHGGTVAREVTIQ